MKQLHVFALERLKAESSIGADALRVAGKKIGIV